ncbi:hypothetical protein XI25_05460 [Paenibacillus sp. DMB20]|nr:hypothetical protein XI25_05460 [Paenibacillus sp. DMB20]
MLDRLQSLADRYEKLSELLCDPDVANDAKKLRDYSKEQSDLQPAYEAYVEYKNVVEELEAAKTMQGEKLDDEMREMVKMEIEELSARSRSWRRKSAFCCFRRTRMTTKTSSSKFAARLAETKRLCLPPICTACIPVMRTARAGRSS